MSMTRKSDPRLEMYGVPACMQPQKMAATNGSCLSSPIFDFSLCIGVVLVEQPDEFPENRTTAPEFSECRYRGAGSGVVLLLGFWCRVLVRVSSHVEVVGVVWWCSSGPVLSSILAQARLRPQN